MFFSCIDIVLFEDQKDKGVKCLKIHSAACRNDSDDNTLLSKRPDDVWMKMRLAESVISILEFPS
jgi:hypothetical protein